MGKYTWQGTAKQLDAVLLAKCSEIRSLFEPDFAMTLHDADPTLDLCVPGRSAVEWLAVDGSRWRTVR